MSVRSAVEPVDEQIAKIRTRLVEAIELANEGGPALGQAALDVEVLLSVVDAHLLSWKQGYDAGYANAVTDSQVEAYEQSIQEDLCEIHEMPVLLCSRLHEGGDPL